ncbi:TldD/PmbA family protein [Candidatus Woesearchaeota archaeon]|nr:TldD/PmbA family protein [Candidatus Woesearchaeota archaeon]
MEKFLKLAEKNGCNFVELKESNSENNTICLEDREVKELSSITSSQFSVRVLYKNKIGFASSNKNNFKELINRAIKTTKSNEQEFNFDFKPYKNKIKTKLKIDPNNISMEEKKNRLISLIKLKKHGIQSLNLRYMDSIRRYKIINSLGTDLEFNDVMSGFLASAFAKKNDRIEQAWEVEKNHFGYEIMNNAENIVMKAMRISIDLLNAKIARGGDFPVIIDQKLGGVFTHEAVGHACEADSILQRASILYNKKNARLGSDILNISDDGSILGNGFIPFDDDGVKSQKNKLIEDGILINFLHSFETASIMKEKLTGNGRAQDLSKRVIPRMTNTFTENGNSSFEEMLKEIKNGYYLKDSAGGEVNPTTGEFIFNSQFGYKIKNGELKHMVKKASLMGMILDILPRIMLIAKDLRLSSGNCGKSGQTINVCTGSPHILIEKAKIGGKI